MLISEIEKEPFDEFGYAIRYHQVLRPGEAISSATLSAIRLLDAVDITATFLASSSASIPSHTANSGTTTTLKGTSDLAVAGFRVGDFVVNETKGYTTLIKAIIFGSIKNDTLVFEAQSVAAAASDIFSAAKAIASLKAGSDGNRVKVIFSATTSLASKFQDEIIVNVKDY